MGPWGAIKKIGKGIGGAVVGGLTGGPVGAVVGGAAGLLSGGGGGGGGGGPTGYVSPNVAGYEKNASALINQRVAGRPMDLTSAAAARKATSPYDFSAINKSIANLSAGSTYKPSTYNPYQFNLTGLPKKYAADAYASSAEDIRREGQGGLEKLRESVGTRRPGLMAKLGSDYGRGIQERLATTRRDIGLEEMKSNVDMAREQQLQQAAENYKAAGFNADEAYKKAQDDLKYTTSLGEAGTSKAKLQSGMVGQYGDLKQAEQADKDRAMEYLIDMFYKTAGFQGDAQRAAAGNKMTGRGQSLDFLASLGKLAAGA